MNTTDTPQVEDSTIPVNERLISTSMPDIDVTAWKTRFDNAPIPETRVNGPFWTNRAQRRTAWRRTFKGRPFKGYPFARDWKHAIRWALPCGDADITALESVRRSIQAKLDKDGRYLPQ